MTKRNISLFIVCTIVISVLASCSTNSPTAISSDSTDTQTSSDSTEMQSSASTEIQTTSASEKSGNKSALFSKINTTTLNGENITGDDFKGDKLTVLNVWATWCPPCIAELPHLQEISEYYKDQGVKIVGVMQDGVTKQFEPIESTIEEGQTILTNAGVEYTVILPDENIILEIIGQIQYLPTTFFLDSEGNVVKTIAGANNTESWRKEIDAILKEIP